MFSGLWHTVKTDSVNTNEAWQNGDVVAVTENFGDLCLTLFSLGLAVRGVRSQDLLWWKI